MADLALLGLRFPVVNGAIQRPREPPRLPKHLLLVTVSGSVTPGPPARVDIHLTGTVRGTGPDDEHEFHVRVAFDARAIGGVLRPADGPHGQPPDGHFQVWADVVAGLGPGPQDPYLVRSGLVALSDEASPRRVYGAGGELWVRFPGTIILNDDRAPLTVVTEGGGVTLDLAAAKLLLDDGFASASASTPSIVPGPNKVVKRLNRLDHQSLPAEESLLEPITKLDLRARPTSKGLLALQSDVSTRSAVDRSNPILTPLAVTGHLLHLELRGEADWGQLIAVEAVREEKTDYTVYVHSIADQLNRFLELSGSEPLPLHLRLGDTVVPGTLFVGPDPEGRRPIELTVTNADPGGRVLHSTLPNVRVDVAPTRRMQLVGGHSAAPTSVFPMPVRIAPALLGTGSAPRLELPHDELRLTVPGDSYAAVDEHAVDPGAIDVRFAAGRIALPVTPLPLVAVLDAALADAEARRLDAVIDALVARVPEARHDSRLVERGAAAVPMDHAFEVGHPMAPGDILTHGDARLKTFSTTVEIGPVKLEARLLPDPAERDYAVIWDPAEIQPLTLRLDPDDVEFAVAPGAVPAPDGARPLAIVKLGRSLTLREVFDREGLQDWTLEEAGPDPLRMVDIVDPRVCDETSWVGVVAFNVPVVRSGKKALDGLVDASAPRLSHLRYIAVTPPVQDSMKAGVSARLLWKRTASADPPGSTQSEDKGAFIVQGVDGRWVDAGLAQLDVQCDLVVDRMFGLASDAVGRNVRIDGHLNVKTRELEFAAVLSSPLALLPDDATRPLVRQILLRSAIVRSDTSGASVLLDGVIDLNSVTVPVVDVRLESLNDLSFEDLGLRLPKPGPDWSQATLDYPSIRLGLDVPPFDLGGVSLQWRGFDVLADGAGVGSFLWLSGQPTGRTMAVHLRLGMMKLPELFARAFSHLNLDIALTIGITPSGTLDPSALRFGISFAGFDFSDGGLKLDLLRFLAVQAKKFSMKQSDGLVRFSVTDPVVTILSKPIIEAELALHVFTRTGGRTAFLVVLRTPQGGALLRIHWFVIGHGVLLAPAAVARLVSVEGLTESGIKLAGQEVNEDDLTAPDGDDALADWLFAAGFDVLGGLLVGKFVVQDRRYYGLALTGSAFTQWLGLDLAASVLYIKGETPSSDGFIATLRVPRIALGVISFQGGLITVDLRVNGDFLFDLGFPRLVNGIRRWERCLGMIITPFQGSGGFYIEYRRSTDPMSVPGHTVVRAGFALQAGLGASFSAPSISVWVTIGVFAIIEGTAQINNASRKIVALDLVGIVGIQFTGAGELNWWIISVRVSVVVGIEVEGRISVSEGQRATLRITGRAYASASAEACIGSGIFRLCRGITVSVPLEVSETLELAV